MKAKMKIVYVDIDGVAADSYRRWIWLYNAEYHKDLKKEDITQYEIAPFIVPECNFSKYFGSYDYVRPEKNAIEAVAALRKQYRIVFATSGDPVNYNWVNGMFSVSRLDYVLLADKFLLRGFALIDDKPANLVGFHGKRYLFGQPWNDGKWDWLSIMDDLL